MPLLKDKLKMTGELKIVLTDKNGNVKDTREINNLVVDAGLAFICDRMVGASSAVMSHMAVGSDNTGTAAGDTTLTELGRVALASGIASTNTSTYIATFPGGTGTGAIVEAGIFNDGTVGDMLCRTVFAVVNKAVDDIMTINWTITLNAV